jgi:hypothetical protein
MNEEKRAEEQRSERNYSRNFFQETEKALPEVRMRLILLRHSPLRKTTSAREGVSNPHQGDQYTKGSKPTAAVKRESW